MTFEVVGRPEPYRFTDIDGAIRALSQKGRAERDGDREEWRRRLIAGEEVSSSATHRVGLRAGATDVVTVRPIEEAHE